MVVARNRSPQTTQRMVDFSGAEAEKPESGRLAVLIDISCNSSVNDGLTRAPDCSCYSKFGARGVEEEDSLCWAVGVKRHHGDFLRSFTVTKPLAERRAMTVCELRRFALGAASVR